MTLVTESVCVGAFVTAILHLVVGDEQPTIDQPVWPTGTCLVIVAMTITTDDYRDITGPFFSRYIRLFQADNLGVRPFFFNRLIGFIGRTRLRLLVGGIGWQVGAICMTLISKFIFFGNLGSKIADPFPGYPAERVFFEN